MTAAITITAAALLALAAWAIWAQRREINRQTDRANKMAGNAWRYQLALVSIAGMSTAGNMAKAARDVIKGEFND